MSEERKKLSLEEATAAVDKWITIRNAKDEKGDAEIEIDGEIGYDWWTGDDSNTAKAIKAKLKEIANMKAKRIVVRINSLGGYIHEGLAIHDALAVNKAEIITDVQGVAASMATVIAQAGKTRRMSDNALYLLHQASGLSWGNINETKAALEDLVAWNDRLVNIYVKRTGKDEEEIRELMDRNNGVGVWIDADEAKEMNLVDEIYEPMKAAANAAKNARDPERFKRFNLPEPPPFKDKQSPLNTDTMSEETKKTWKEAFEDFKNEVREILNIKKDEALPEEVINKLTEFDARIKEVEEENKTEELTEKVNSLTAELETANSAIQEKDSAIETLKNEKAQLEGDLTKKKAKSTKTESPEGRENPDAPVDKEMEALNRDAAKLRAELMVTHVDDHVDEDDDD
jgi:ATP-dependent Clp protease protease subunit